MLLSKSDYEDINILIRIEYKIKSYYNNLCSLEQIGKNKIEEYKNILKKLKLTLTLENIVFDRLTSEPKKIENIISFINHRYIDMYDLALVVPCSIFEKDKVRTRIINGLIIRNLDYDNSIVKKVIPLKLSQNKTLNETIKQIDLFASQMFKMLYQDIISLALSINDTNTNSLLKNELTYIKYKMMFLFRDFEHQFIDNNFQIEQHPYLSSMNVTNFYKLPKQFLEKIRVSVCEVVALEQVMRILNINEYDFLNPLTMANSVTSQSLLRASLIIAGNDGGLKIKENINKIIKFRNSEKIYSELVGIKMIKEAISKSEEDNSIPQFVYFKKM